MRRALVTGGAGFIGSHVVDALLSNGWHVDVIDSFDPFYDPAIKHRNIAAHRDHPHYTLYSVDIRDQQAIRAVPGDFDAVVHLAARAGVRPSIADPTTYQDVNVDGTQNLLEFARQRQVPQFVFASSSSVYGVNPRVPWSEEDHVLAPISPYASTKVSGELLGHVYSHLYGLRFVALRFFTVYGERQRPDLAIHKFAQQMRYGQPIPVFGDGSTRRDYTHVSDIVRGILAALDYSGSPYEVINLGNSQTVSLTEMISTLEDVLGIPARRELLPPQPGDVPQTWAHLGKANRLLAFRPQVEFHDGCAAFVGWLRQQPQPVVQAKR
ncbi:NAD-dependent epimerase/dehydratase family protein [Deinococcus yunweiensis]|uniref:NAD-dependent epimerase/dehydratase family protein n=1 Tax=Deinococcus yunweiensis TaxID=367282 RepID=UPI00398EC3C8